jgi:oligosaccharide repeat unit polymerase
MINRYSDGRQFISLQQKKQSSSMMINIQILLKIFVALFVIILFFLGKIDFINLIGILFVCFAIDLTIPFLFKNLFLIYTLILFLVGGLLFLRHHNDISLDMLGYLSSFIIGYWFLKIIRKDKTRIDCPIYTVATNKIDDIYMTLSKHFLVFSCIIQLSLWLGMIIHYGILNYYAGVFLVNSIHVYGKENLAWGGLLLFSNFINAISFSSFVLYSVRSFKVYQRISLFLPSIALILIPLLEMNRSACAIGFFLFLILIYLNDRERSYSLYILGLASLVVVIFIVFIIGLIRQNALTHHSRLDLTKGIAFQLLTEELTGIKTYYTIKKNIGILKYQYGKTIIFPMLFQFIPRSWMPDKPLNSAGYFNQKLYPSQASAGFYASPPIFGDLYLNFGYWGSLCFIFLLGMYWSSLDTVLVKHNNKKLAQILFSYYFFYPILRGGLEGPVAIMFYTWIIYLFLQAFIYGLSKAVYYYENSN